MENSKQKIKRVAISLFNERGISSVSMKQIADHLVMSAGNLSYHYKTKEVLLTAINGDMQEESSNYILPENKYITLHHFEEMMLQFDDLQSRYAFFFNDIVHIMKTYPIIAKQFEEISLNRLKEGKELIQYYIASGRLKPEEGMINYDQLAYSIWMVSTFWQSQKQILRTDAVKVGKDPSIKMLWGLLLPYLTEKGLEEYQQIRQFVKLPTNP